MMIKELISGAKDVEYRYQYDDIGNRISSYDLGTNRTYTANNLNQYTSISNSASSALSAVEFIPQFDDDGNQTLIQTASGIWSVTYNGENRPILWECVSFNSPTPPLTHSSTCNSSTPNSPTPPLISMSYDRMGRRVTKNDQRFVYDGYLQIANFEEAATNSQLTTYNSQLFIWDPAEPVATRPLVWNSDNCTSVYTHDGNKNVSEVINSDDVTVAHYEYTPFGAVAKQYGDCAAVNPWRFSSEYTDDAIFLVYHNYRHYDQMTGRWLQLDLIEEFGGINLYLYTHNNPENYSDLFGLVEIPPPCPKDIDRRKKYDQYFISKNGQTYIIYDYRVDQQVTTLISVNGCSIPSSLNWLPAARLFNSLFNDACNNHDKCYGTCNNDKESCDDGFFEEMIASCSSYSNDIGDQAYCRTMAYVFYLAVSKGGSSFYEAAQDEYCEHDKCSQCWSGK